MCAVEVQNGPSAASNEAEVKGPKDDKDKDKDSKKEDKARDDAKDSEGHKASDKGPETTSSSVVPVLSYSEAVTSASGVPSEAFQANVQPTTTTSSSTSSTTVTTSSAPPPPPSPSPSFMATSYTTKDGKPMAIYIVQETVYFTESQTTVETVTAAAEGGAPSPAAHKHRRAHLEHLRRHVHHR